MIRIYLKKIDSFKCFIVNIEINLLKLLNRFQTLDCNKENILCGQFIDIWGNVVYSGLQRAARIINFSNTNKQ